VTSVSSVHQWAVAVRLSDGSLRYLCPSDTRRGGQDDWSPRADQAVRFVSESDAQEVAATFDLSTSAKEYLVVRV